MSDANEDVDTLPQPANSGSNRILSVLAALISAGLWAVLLWAVYVRLPLSRQLFDDFGTDIGPLTEVVLSYAPWALPPIAVAASLSLAVTQSRKVRWFVLFGLPLILLLAVVLAVGPNLLSLINQLAYSS